MTINSEATVGELVAEDFRRATAFKKFGIDFCCGGGRTVRAACESKKIDLKELEQELERAVTANASSLEHQNSWDLDFLADLIVNTHHRYVRAKLPEISEYANKVAKVHGDHHPETREIARHFAAVSSELSQHMEKEEQVLFPYVKSLVAARNENHAPFKPPFETVNNPIRMMEQEHQLVGDEFADIRNLSNNYQPPADACATYRVLFSNLKEFDEDLQRHIHLENNILFPKSAKLEAELVSKSVA